MCGHAPLLA
ncbi:hypothetical protein Patl1_21493 [Pistacia atlantica]|uniref:Uncharacterized protein n=1 Tax=Pistacia atlantica TaxID=434234 RepID=A0ACC1BN00_9ROSI|nr:hypothetical protein Patl1_21493 [Pistacia atlantica]